MPYMTDYMARRFGFRTQLNLPVVEALVNTGPQDSQESTRRIHMSNQTELSRTIFKVLRQYQLFGSGFVVCSLFWAGGIWSFLAKAVVLATLFPVLAIFGIYWSHLEEVPLTGRRRFMWFDKEADDELGYHAAEDFRNFLDKSDREILQPDDPIVIAVETVLKQLFQGVSHLGFKFEVCVFEDFAKSEAFTMPGGRIFLTTQRLSELASPGQLAALLSHEMSHEISRHGAEKKSCDKILVFLTTLLGQHDELAGGRILSATLQSRLFELECDKMGLRIMATAGFDPQESIELMHGEAKRDRIRQNKDAEMRVPELARTHPLWATRIQNVQSSLADVRVTFANDQQPMLVNQSQWNHILSAISARAVGRIVFLREVQASAMSLLQTQPRVAKWELDNIQTKLRLIRTANPSMSDLPAVVPAVNKATPRIISNKKADVSGKTKGYAVGAPQNKQEEQANAVEEEKAASSTM